MFILLNPQNFHTIAYICIPFKMTWIMELKEFGQLFNRVESNHLIITSLWWKNLAQHQLIGETNIYLFLCELYRWTYFEAAQTNFHKYRNSLRSSFRVRTFLILSSINRLNDRMSNGKSTSKSPLIIAARCI